MTDSFNNISIIIPTLNAEKYIEKQLESLQSQSIELSEIIVIDSDSTDKTREIAQNYPNVSVLKIDRKDFNHGGTRDWALRKSKGDFVFFLTQDALPKSDHYVENMLKPFRNTKVAMVTGRQYPRDDARPSERLVRLKRYTPNSRVTTFADIERLGMDAFFASDTCSAYRRSAYLAVGGFERDVLTNEDMFIAAKFLKEGYAVAYEGDAEVFHSHNFTYMQQYRRNYVVGMEIERHKELLMNTSETGQGFSLVKYVVGNLLKEGHPIEAVRFIGECGFRFMGNRLGRRNG
ncbi:glycosyltransferase [Bifidobacterium magnum]|uniref:Glycosyl transferase family 2 n=1 Tax=Bifidobacterium magnum TaxID=1692 RepID=A0A087BBB9_9BIFI|nr:glycosyltransferase family 2 protein [Bifidobacterium magnum]KFI68319.1 Glycosyl transferase family 2 [Bifidobacterium magnum]